MYANEVYQFTKERPARKRTTRPLTNTEVFRYKATDKDLMLHVRDWRFMVVETNIKKLWRFRYQRPATKQRNMMGLGAFPALSLADARRLRADYLSLLANGIDAKTQAEQVTEQQQIALDSIFSTVAANLVCFETSQRYAGLR